MSFRSTNDAGLTNGIKVTMLGSMDQERGSIIVRVGNHGAEDKLCEIAIQKYTSASNSYIVTCQYMSVLLNCVPLM
jgi:hypothetical protein